MDLKPGTRWASQVCDTEVVVVRAPTRAGVARVRRAPDDPGGRRPALPASPGPGVRRGLLIGKRFADPDSGLELLVTKAGEGTLAVDGIAIPLKEAKPLPSSD